MGKVMKTALGLGMAGSALLGGKMMAHGAAEFNNRVPTPRSTDPKVVFEAETYNRAHEKGGAGKLGSGLILADLGIVLGATGLNIEKRRRLDANNDPDSLELKVGINNLDKKIGTVLLIGGALFSVGTITAAISDGTPKHAPPGASIDAQTTIDINNNNEAGAAAIIGIVGGLAGMATAVWGGLEVGGSMEYGKDLAIPPIVELGRPLRGTL